MRVCRVEFVLDARVPNSTSYEFPFFSQQRNSFVHESSLKGCHSAQLVTRSGALRGTVHTVRALSPFLRALQYEYEYCTVLMCFVTFEYSTVQCTQSLTNDTVALKERRHRGDSLCDGDAIRYDTRRWRRVASRRVGDTIIDSRRKRAARLRCPHFRVLPAVPCAAAPE